MFIVTECPLEPSIQCDQVYITTRRSFKTTDCFSFPNACYIRINVMAKFCYIPMLALTECSLLPSVLFNR